ncbi:MAG TPA: nicotinate-nucleotide adenylyltransferase [Methylotenera sp.]|nr:nicotinate-nucleotide adenylyltransferase [Methylotenera sp.]
MRTIGLLGGTFDPIHFGHLRMAQELAEALSLDEVRFIPAAIPPHKATPSVSAKNRAAMVRLAISNNPLFSLDERELDRSGASYTLDTLLSLRDELGKDTSLILLMGSDAFTKLNTWHRWQEIITLSHIALVQRPTNNATGKEALPKELETFLQDHYAENSKDLLATPAGLVTMQQITALDISATHIRTSLQKKQSVRYLMPDNVIEYIEAQGLYTA